MISAVADIAKAAHAGGVSTLGGRSWLPVALGTIWGLGLFRGCTSLPPAETGGVPREFQCESSMPYYIRAQDTGFSECKGSGLMHRARASVCPTFLPRGAAEVKQAIAWEPAKAQGFECQSDEDCKTKVNGVCERVEAGGGSHCVYGCRADPDCAADELCHCDYPVGRCVHALCRTDEECAGGAVCGEYVPKTDCNGVAYACQSPKDECASRSCWGSGSASPAFCTLDENRRRVCSKNIACSKP